MDAKPETAPPEVETTLCTLCAGEPSPMFYTGCLIRDGHIADCEWECDGKGHLTRKAR